MKVKNRKELLSWAFYDFGNSAYSTTVMAGFFPIFFKQYWSLGTDAIVTTARLGTLISACGLVMALLSPLLGIWADLKGVKKISCLFFTLLGVIACAWMAFIPSGGWITAMAAYAAALMSFNAAAVFYDSLLPSVATDSEMDYASSLGYALGYLGGGILFLVNVAMYLSPATFGLADGVSAVKFSFMTVAVWWFLFSLPLAKNVPEPATNISKENIWRLTALSLKQLRQTWRDLMNEPNRLIFMIAYWLYIDGVYTVMTMAVDYGAAIGLEAKDLIAALLITQFIGFPCAYYFGRITHRWGTKKPILFCIVIYTLTVVFATMMNQAWHFYALATIIGMVQGGVQSLSRSLFGKMIPKEKSGEYFGLFNLVGRFASILGPLVVAVVVTLTGNSRLGMTGLLVLFVAGGFLLVKVKEPAVQPRV